MKKMGIIFSHAPYGNSLGQEGLNFALSAACYTDNIALFFVSDGIFQIFNMQNANFIYLKNYYRSFKILKSCGVKDFYVCSESLMVRGFSSVPNFIVHAKQLSINNIRKKLSMYDYILNF